MDEFARSPTDERRVFILEAAARRGLTPVVIEKDFWACWTLRRLVETPALNDITFKGGTSLSKAYGIIDRFSEDIDLTLRRTAALIADVPSQMDQGLGTNERRRRSDALKAAAQAHVATVALPALTQAVAAALGTTDGWTIVPDPDDRDQQTLLFHYPAAITRPGPGYIQSRLKLEYGARGEPEPREDQSITPYLAQEFPDQIPNAVTMVPTLSVERTYWEKVTLLHALHHKGTLGPHLSRHYYDLMMLDLAGVTDRALAQPDLLKAVVRNKSVMFAQASASYDTAVPGQLRVTPTAGMTRALSDDYAAMADMFMTEPPQIDELLAALAALETRLNASPEPEASAA